MAKSTQEKLSEYQRLSAQAHEQVEIWKANAARHDGVIEFLHRELAEEQAEQAEQQRLADIAEAERQQRARDSQIPGMSDPDVPPPFATPDDTMVNARANAMEESELMAATEAAATAMSG